MPFLEIGSSEGQEADPLKLDDTTKALEQPNGVVIARRDDDWVPDPDAPFEPAGSPSLDDEDIIVADPARTWDDDDDVPDPAPPSPPI
jgi:hypothetical protein